MKELLRELDLGSSVAEFDRQLENYFVETQPFRELVSDRRDIVAGDKGTGKTALFQILHRRYASIRELRDVVVLPAFNPTGSPIFQQLGEKGPLPEGEYIQLWKAYILSIVGNWLLRHNKPRPRSSLLKLDQLLRGLDLRSEADAPQPVFAKIMASIGSWFRWKSAEVEVSTTVEGLSFTPRVEFDGEPQEKPVVSVDAALLLLSNCLDELGKTVWVALDRLDEAFQGFPEIEIPALRALFRSYLDLLAYPRVRLKLFVRRDLFSRITEGGFVNLTHVNARKVDVIWDEEDLLSLLGKRIKQNGEFCKKAEIKNRSDSELFYLLFPKQIDQGSRKPDTWVWMMGRIRDGNGVKPPRNLIDLVSMAKDAQIRREEREPRAFEPDRPIIEADAVRKALAQLSEQRVNDTLFAEAHQYADAINLFRKGKAEHNWASISELMKGRKDVQEQIAGLVRMGFLEEVGGNFKIPMLYRGGLEITQGKAFEDGATGEIEDE